MGALDRVIQRVAHLAQPALLSLGVFGYFYTVLPVFQNQQLQEQAARLELEKTQAQRQLNSLVAQQNTVANEIRQLRENWQRERGRSTLLADAAASAKQKEFEARRRGADAELALESQLKTLDAARWELVLLDFTLAHFRTSYNSMIGRANSRSGDAPGAFILAAETNWPQPYGALLTAVESASQKRTGREKIPESYYLELRKFVEARQASIQCSKPDLDAMHAGFLTQFAALDSRIDAETARKVEEVKNEYETKGQRVKITAEYRDATRRSIRFGKVYELEKTYSDRIDALTKECDKRATTAIDEFRRLKGVSG